MKAIVDFLSYEALPPLWVGISYLLLSLLGRVVVHGIRTSFARTPARGVPWWRSWGGWPFLAQIGATLWSVGWLFAFLVQGLLASQDVGLGGLQDPGEWIRLVALALGLGAWLALLWGLQWRKSKLYTRAPALSATETDVAAVPLQGLHHEADMAILRAALIPSLGVYWGVWLGLAVKDLWAGFGLLLQGKHKDPGRNTSFLLAGALDIVGVALFVVSGNVWAAVLGRTIGRALILVVHHAIWPRDAVPVSPVALDLADH